MKIKCCYKCEDRHLGCHSECEKYISERAKLDRINNKTRKDREANLLLTVGALKGRSKQAIRKKNNF